MCYIYENLSGSLVKGTQLNELNMAQCLLLILLKSSYQVIELTKNWKEALGGRSKNTFALEGAEGGPKTNRGRGSSLSVCSFCEKNRLLIFQTANRFLSDKLLGSCWKFFCFEPSPAIFVIKRNFLLKRCRHCIYITVNGIFLWILRSFKKTFFYGRPLGDCFCQ